MGSLSTDETIASGNGVSGDSYATTISDFSDLSDTKFTDHSNLNDDQKLEELKLIFQDRFKDHTLRFILRQANGNLENAFDELLNRQYLEDSGSLPKGIEGFAVDEWKQAPKGKSGRSKKAGNAKTQKLAVDYKTVSATINDAELEGAKTLASPTTTSRSATPFRPAITTRQSSAPPPALTPSSLTPAHLRATAASLRRMGPLGRQAASVYAERAHSQTLALTAQTSRTADAHVARQSTATTIDLHGVCVTDGVRITRARVWSWWEGLKDYEYRHGKKGMREGEGLTVVTGMGNHSVGGVSRLRQAVGAYLRNDGWRVETGTGRFYVTGRV